MASLFGIQAVAISFIILADIPAFDVCIKTRALHA